VNIKTKENVAMQTTLLNLDSDLDSV